MTNVIVWTVLGLTMAASFVVKWWLKRTYRIWSRVENQYKVTGAQTAAAILKSNNVTNVRIESTRGKLTDHFDPQRDILRLSTSNFAGTSVAAMAVSAHEAGHAIQDATGDIRLKMRRFLVPLAALGSRFGPYIILPALMFRNPFMLQLAMWLLAGTMAFQLMTLPVEFNASKRAVKNLEELGLSDPSQRAGTRRVLNAAALTYVAAAATSIAYFSTLVVSRSGRTRI